MQEVLDTNQVIDLWRTRNPKTRRYTWGEGINGPRKSRLDYIYVTQSLENEVTKSGITCTGMSYLNMPYLDTTTGKPKGLWWLNTRLLLDPTCVKKIIKILEKNE